MFVPYSKSVQTAFRMQAKKEDHVNDDDDHNGNSIDQTSSAAASSNEGVERDDWANLRGEINAELNWRHQKGSTRVRVCLLYVVCTLSIDLWWRDKEWNLRAHVIWKFKYEKVLISDVQFGSAIVEKVLVLFIYLWTKFNYILSNKHVLTINVDDGFRWISAKEG